MNEPKNLLDQKIRISSLNVREEKLIPYSKRIRKWEKYYFLFLDCETRNRKVRQSVSGDGWTSVLFFSNWDGISFPEKNSKMADCLTPFKLSYQKITGFPRHSSIEIGNLKHIIT